MLDSHYDLSVLEILHAKALHKEYEETTGVDTPGEVPRVAIDRGGDGHLLREPVAKIPRRMFADSIRRCPADVLLDLCEAPPAWGSRQLPRRPHVHRGVLAAEGAPPLSPYVYGGDCVNASRGRA